MTIKEAKERLEEAKGDIVFHGKKVVDSERYHSEFDDILEERLHELDPKFMEAMDKLYYKSGASRWYA